MLCSKRESLDPNLKRFALVVAALESETRGETRELDERPRKEKKEKALALEDKKRKKGGSLR